MRRDFGPPRTPDKGRGTLQVMLRGETTIADGLEAGDATDEV